jgi:hypothetical protein
MLPVPRVRMSFLQLREACTASADESSRPLGGLYRECGWIVQTSGRPVSRVRMDCPDLWEACIASADVSSRPLGGLYRECGCIVQTSGWPVPQVRMYRPDLWVACITSADAFPTVAGMQMNTLSPPIFQKNCIFSPA